MFSIFKKKKNKKQNTDSSFEGRLEEIQKQANNQKNVSKHQLVDMCEQMVDTFREYEDAKSEYQLLTSYLNDVQIIEDLSGKQLETLREIATFVSNLNEARMEFLKAENKISDVQFAQMQEMEEEIPKAIERLKSNETYLDTIKRDLKYIEGEKVELTIFSEDSKKEQEILRKLSIVALILFASIVVLLTIAVLAYRMNIQVAFVICALVATVVAAYILIRYKENSWNIKKCEMNINHAILLENRVKIKYVNLKNAVDYALEKYHVKNSKEFEYNYQLYLEAVKEREKFRRTNDDLEYYNDQLITMLEKLELYDARVWLNHANAILDRKELVELKHDLLVRRQKIRARMEYNLEEMSKVKKYIEYHMDDMGEISQQLKVIIKKMDELEL